jgi:ABC-2 type transport system permease protein
MQAFRTLVRRELGAHFLSLTGYVVIATVLLLLGVSFIDVLSKLNGDPADSPLTEVFYMTLYFWMILLLTTPIITMRTFALEKFTGTYETLMTTPVSDLVVVLSKYVGSLIFYAITWLPLLGYMFVVQRYINRTGTALDPYAAGTTFLGILLVGSLFISAGCFASSITRSQVIAAVFSYALGLTLFLLSLRSLVPIAAKNWEAAFFRHIAMGEHMQDFARGVIELSSVTYYVSMTILFLFLTWRAVESRRWN